MPAIDDIFTATVRDLTSEGTGVVEHANGQVFFVPGVWPGETGEFRVTGFRKRVGFAELVHLTGPSADRVAPGCPHHGFSARDCGGCAWQFVSVAAQHTQKQERVRQAMLRLGADNVVQPIWPSPDAWGYRNRAQFKSDGKQLGYVSARSNRLAAIGDCPVLTGQNRQTLRELLDMLPNKEWQPGRKAPWVTLDIDEGVTAATVAVNRRRPFRQGNSVQNRRMRQWLGENLIGADKSRPALELFAGLGNFTGVIAAAGFPGVKAVEGVAEAVMSLNACGPAGVTAQAVNLFDQPQVKALAEASIETGTLVLDPPRDGFKAMASLLAALPHLSRILYVSCDLATFSRDLAMVQQAGFQLWEIQPLDMFPHTPHVEILAVATIDR